MYFNFSLDFRIIVKSGKMTNECQKLLIIFIRGANNMSIDSLFLPSMTNEMCNAEK